LTEVGNLLEDYNKDFLIEKILTLDDPSSLNISMMNLLKKFTKIEKVDKFYW